MHQRYFWCLVPSYIRNQLSSDIIAFLSSLSVYR